MKTRKQLHTHGFVQLTNIASHFSADQPVSDTDTAKVARTSTGQFAERAKELDMQLSSYLLRNAHTTPFEFTDTWWDIKLPIFVFRQYDRHRTAKTLFDDARTVVSINEVSARYTELPMEFYIPDVIGGTASNIKQGKVNNLSKFKQWFSKKLLVSLCTVSFLMYQLLIWLGVAKEHARMVLPLNTYTQLRFKIDLHNLMHLLSLRLDAHAQEEARDYAQAMYGIMCSMLPETMKLFDKFKRKATPEELQVMQNLLNALKNPKIMEVEQIEALEHVARLAGLNP